MTTEISSLVQHTKLSIMYMFHLAIVPSPIQLHTSNPGHYHPTCLVPVITLPAWAKTIVM